MGQALEKVFIVFLVAITGIWKAIPVGYLLKLDPVLVMLATIAGAFIGVFMIYGFGKQVKRYIFNRLEKKRSLQKRSKRFSAIFEKYGPAGVGLISTLILGPNLTMALGLVIVRSDRKLLFWTLAGTLIWSVILTLVAYSGIEIFNRIHFN